LDKNSNRLNLGFGKEDMVEDGNCQEGSTVLTLVGLYIVDTMLGRYERRNGASEFGKT